MRCCISKTEDPSPVNLHKHKLVTELNTVSDGLFLSLSLRSTSYHSVFGRLYTLVSRFVVIFVDLGNVSIVIDLQ